MQINPLQPGSYVIAVSGGVDSMVLLELLSIQNVEDKNIELIVAHLDHGIRADSNLDKRLVEKRATDLGLRFETSQAKLGPLASEELAREVRYKFLNEVKRSNKAKALITAHHQDDVIETAIINMIRGTGRKGLSSLNSNEDVIRPLLDYRKKEILRFAESSGVIWREDSTNSNPKYLRNYVRQNIVPRLTHESRATLLSNIKNMRKLNVEIDTLIDKHLKDQGDNNQILRSWFNNLPHNVAREIMATWLRQNEVKNFDKKTIDRLVIAAKTASVGKQFSVSKGVNLYASKTYLALDTRER
jgi:tRNA(Ile)-lysidine synthetase-like protein